MKSACIALAAGALLVFAPARTAAQLSSAQQIAGQAMIDTAWNEIRTNPQSAGHIFERQLPLWAAFSKQSIGYIEADSGSLVAAILARNDFAASVAWSRIGHESAAGIIAQPEPSGDRFAEQGDWPAAFRSYRTENQFGSSVCSLQTNRGLDAAIQGRLPEAMRLWSLRPSCDGPYDVTDVQLALAGIAFAAQGRWPEATSMWIRAARQRRNVPQLDALYAGNVMALSMLYHFRRSIEADRPPHRDDLDRLNK